MPYVPIDLTTVGLIPAGEYVGTVVKLSYQVKVGEKWNLEGTADVEPSVWNEADDKVKRLHFSISIPEKGYIFYDLYVAENARGFLKSFLKACDVPFDKKGFDPDACIGKQIGVSIIIEDDPLYGERNRIDKVYKVA